MGHQDPSEPRSVSLFAQTRVELTGLADPPLWEHFFNSQRMGRVFPGARPAWRLHLQGKRGMKKQGQETWVTEPNPQPWQYEVAAISWLALAVQRLQDTFFQQKHFALRYNLSFK